MKYLLLFLLFTSCSYTNYNKLPLKFQLNDNVKYLVPDFYKKVCSGNATISGYNENAYNYDGSQIYFIRNSWKETDCPSQFIVKVEEISLIEDKK